MITFNSLAEVKNFSMSLYGTLHDGSQIGVLDGQPVWPKITVEEYDSGEIITIIQASLTQTSTEYFNMG